MMNAKFLQKLERKKFIILKSIILKNLDFSYEKNVQVLKSKFKNK